MDYETELRQVHKKLKDIETALNESTIVAITNPQGIIQFVNKKFCDISQYKEEELIGNTHQMINSNYHGREFFKEMWRTIGTGNVWKGEIRNKAKDGSYYWVDTTIVPFLNDRGKPYQYIAIRHDITDRKQYEQTIKKMAFYDPLTSLPNHNLLGKWLQAHSNKEQTTVLFIDFNRFKAINDKFGHHIGDVVLQKVSQRLKQCLSETDFISRLGWDEFIVVLNRVTDRSDIITIVQQIIQQLTIPYDVMGIQIHLSLSIGISIGTWDKENESDIHFIESLINQADIAMNHAKEKNDNSYCFNTPDQNIEINRYYQLEQEIKSALEKNQFTVHYQPIMELKSEKMIGVEALLRWKHPKLGNVSPAEFIPILEELGLIVQIGRWVLQTVCDQMRIWQDSGIYLEKACVNVSPIQFHHKDFTASVKHIIEETRLDPAYLELEITEGTILNINETHQVFKDLKECGISISIDDFGTGYSSLGYLKNLPINTLKMDKSFINDLDQDSKVIVDTMINMGKNLNFIVLAEGIEQKEQLDYLNQKSCHLGQGYYWSKPVNGKEIPALYKRFKV